VDFLLLLTELFSARCYGWRANVLPRVGVGTSLFRFVNPRIWQTHRHTGRQKGLRNSVRCISCSRTVIKDYPVDYKVYDYYPLGLQNSGGSKHDVYW